MERLSKKLSRTKLVDQGTIHRTELSRCLTKFDLTTLGVATTLGAGIYVLTGTLARNVVGPGLVLSFFVAAVASILAGLCYAEFGSRIPRVGSAYVFSYVTIGEFCAFVIGWNLILEYIIGTSSVARAWSSYLDSSLLNDIIKNTTTTGLGKLSASGILATYPDFLAFLLILVVTVTLCFGVKLTSVTTNIITAINIIVIVLIIIVGATFAEGANWTDNFLPYGFSGVLAAAASAFYAFVGFDVIATAVEESNNPSKDVPIATILTIGKYIFQLLSFLNDSSMLIAPLFGC